MWDHHSKNICILLVISFFLFFSSSTYAANNPGYIEYSQSFDVKTFESIKSVGLFARSNSRHGELVYGGLQFSQFEHLNNAENSGIFRIVIGATTTGQLAPFIEVSTDFLSALILSSNNDEENNCDNDNSCRPDGFIKAGIRYEVTQGIRLGLFYEAISFGGNHTQLKDEHNQTGWSVSYDF